MRAPPDASSPDLLDLTRLNQRRLFDAKPVPNGEPLMVPIGQIDEDPRNPRTEFPPHAIDELARDIAERGILQPIVVTASDETGRYLIRFGSTRCRAARQAGLDKVPVVLATRAHDAYDQVAENFKRHGLSPLELARFMRSRSDAGESNAMIGQRLGIDQTTVAHHLALLHLPPVLDAALKSGRCTSPRALYELSKVHADQPERVAELVAGSAPITRDAVAGLRDTALLEPVVTGTSTPPAPRRNPTAQALARACGLCHRLDAALLRLSRIGTGSAPPDDMAALRQRVVELARRLGA